MLAVLGLLLGIVSLGLGVGNTAQIMDLKATVANLNNHVLENRHTINLLTKGLEKLSKESDAIIEYVHEETYLLNQGIEGVRCDSYNRDRDLSARIALVEHERYFHTHVTTVMNAALTGSLTPEVLGINGLLTILRLTPGLKDSFVQQDPSIVYNQAKV